MTANGYKLVVGTTLMCVNTPQADASALDLWLVILRQGLMVVPPMANGGGYARSDYLGTRTWVVGQIPSSVTGFTHP